MYVFAIPAVVGIRLVKPWLLVRIGALNSASIGHFAGNTELYLCERDAGINKPMQRHVDILYLNNLICNKQLAIMWKRVLRIWPAWILAPIARVNRLIPGGTIHEVGNNAQGPMDVYNLLDRFPPHLQFTAEETVRGEAGLRAMGISTGVPFVCLIARDTAYLASRQLGEDYSYHNFRNSDIQSYVLAAEELAERGYIVIRMGSKVFKAMETSHPMVIDYATNGMRSDFMDIYLGAKCAFCITSGTGWDAIPQMLRRPLVCVNWVTLGYIFTSRAEYLTIPKKHVLQDSQKIMTLQEIFSHEVGICQNGHDYKSKGIGFVDNTPEEIRDVVVEMAERLNGTWQPHEDDEALQKRLWEIYPKDVVDGYQGRPIHGEIRARLGAAFLRNNRDWLQ
jgi:putative glycosyltransferase (TIGR04372 family)